MNARPVVSVHMAVKDGARFLRAALDSVHAQTYDAFEVIVVDGGSTDDSVAIATSFEGVRCLSQRGTGFAGAWNEAIEASTGDLIAFLDSDDLWHPTKLERQVERLGGAPPRAYSLTRVRFVLEPGVSVPPGFRPEMLGRDHVAPMPGALVIARDDFALVGPFSTDYGIASDIDWFARAKDMGFRQEVVEEELLHKRVHDANLSYFHADDLNVEILRLLRASLHRQEELQRIPAHPPPPTF